MPELTTDDFQVGWICAVQTELVAAWALLDEKYDDLPQKTNDNNMYVLGRIGQHNVVLACLPSGRYGTTSAATVATDMMRSFESIRFGLMVGIGGGAPTRKNDIRLGDVVISTPARQSGGVINYDSGKVIQDKKFERTGALDAPPQLLLNAVSRLRAKHSMEDHQISTYVDKITASRKLKKSHGRPSSSTDNLYLSTFTHQDRNEPCSVICADRTSQKVFRPERDEGDEVQTHYGIIASSDKLMKDANMRDMLAETEGVMCFEMEAAGLLNTFKCLVIRGICDYSDTHKNDDWQGYAAATAASYAKELLLSIPALEVSKLSKSATEQVINNYNPVVFNNYGRVGNQAHNQTIHGDMRFS